MKEYTEDTYGERVASVYDEWHNDFEAAAIDVLSQLTGEGKALELGIGSGRIALPLAERGVQVQGIDNAPAMIARLREKSAGERIEVSIGDFSQVNVQGEFALVYVVFNTFFMLLTQEAQVRCFRNVAAHLAPGGSFLIEAFVPDLKRFEGEQTNRVTKIGMDYLEMDVSQHERADQRVFGHKVAVRDGGIHLYPIQIRYVWPSEMDLMAQLAGLRLRERWSDWKRSPFTSQSGKHISLYELAPS